MALRNYHATCGYCDWCYSDTSVPNLEIVAHHHLRRETNVGCQSVVISYILA